MSDGWNDYLGKDEKVPDVSLTGWQRHQWERACRIAGGIDKSGNPVWKLLPKEKFAVMIKPAKKERGIEKC